MKIGPKYKICKRLGPDVFEKCQTPRFALVKSRVAKRKKRGRPSRSDYGKHVLEKQRVRFTYGISERQFSRYVKESALTRGAKSVEQLYRRIESRLDNVVYRLSLARSRSQARQIVSHGHILVNGRRITSPSYAVRVGATVSIRESSRDNVLFRSAEQGSEERQGTAIPQWLAFDSQKKEGVLIALPTPDVDVLPFDLQSVIEFYSR